MRYTSTMLHTMCDNLNASMGVDTRTHEATMTAGGLVLSRDGCGWQLCRYVGGSYGTRELHSLRVSAAAMAQILQAVAQSR
jgi:hypothetical protein